MPKTTKESNAITDKEYYKVYQLLDSDGYESYYGCCYESREEAQRKCDLYNKDQYSNYSVIERKVFKKITT